MKAAIQAIVSVALEFWESGCAGPSWNEGQWQVHPLSPADEEGLQIAVFGPTASGQIDRADLYVYRKECLGEPRQHDPLISEVLISSMPTKWKSALIQHARCKLFWPGPRDTALWANAQVALYFLQRGWLISEDTEAWTWSECIEPLFKLSRPGRQALEEGSLGFETLQRIVRNYVNPMRPGDFRSYIRSIVKRSRVDSFKSRRAELSNPTETLQSLRNREQFFAFVRQRRQRGYPGVILRQGRLHATAETWETLVHEWIASNGRRGFVKAVTSKMVDAGAAEQSAQRQVRRWIKQSGSHTGALKLLADWQKRKHRSGDH